MYTSSTGHKIGDELSDMYCRMKAHFGHLGWWPGDSPFEVIVGAILTQNTAWRNVERAIENLVQADVLNTDALWKLDKSKLAGLLRPAGYFNVKARRLKSFLEFLFSKYSGSTTKMFKTRLPILRKELLAVNGIGEETADSILLYAGGKTTFVIDAYTIRVISRHGLASCDAAYSDLKALFEKNLPKRTGLFKDFHAQIVYVGKEFCRPRRRCHGCPLESWLNGPEHACQENE